MNLVSFRIAIAVLIGSIIGARLAIWLSPHHPVFIGCGIVVGGCVGYIAFEPVKFFAELWQSITKSLEDIKLPSWREIKETVAIGCVLIAAVLIPVNFFSGLVIYGGLILDDTNPYGLFNTLMERLTVTGFIAISIFQVFMGFMIYRGMKDDPKLLKDFRFLPLAVTMSCPGFVLVAIPIAAIALVGYVLWQVLKRIPRIMRMTLIAIHCDRRTICFVDAIIGGTVGYFCGNEFVGAIAGAFVGVVHHQLVQNRFKQLMPKSV